MWDVWSVTCGVRDVCSVGCVECDMWSVDGV